MGQINLEKQLNSVVEIGNFDVQESLDNRNKVCGYDGLAGHLVGG